MDMIGSLIHILLLVDPLPEPIRERVYQAFGTRRADPGVPPAGRGSRVSGRRLTVPRRRPREGQGMRPPCAVQQTPPAVCGPLSSGWWRNCSETGTRPTSGLRPSGAGGAGAKETTKHRRLSGEGPSRSPPQACSLIATELIHHLLPSGSFGVGVKAGDSAPYCINLPVRRGLAEAERPPTLLEERLRRVGGLPSVEMVSPLSS
ncbi:unnamed protein product [Lota lota]